VEHAAHQLHGLIQPVEALAEARTEVDAHGLVLGLEPGAADTQDRASCAHVVERSDHLHDQSGVAEGVGADHQAEGHLPGDSGPAGERHVALEDGSARVADDGIQVIPRPERVVPQVVHRLAEPLERGPVGVLGKAEHPNLELCRHVVLLLLLCSTGWLDADV